VAANAVSADRIPLAEIRRALVIKLRHHGDVLLSTPVFQVLKRQAPAAEIDALVYADTAPMLALHPALGELHAVDRDWKALGPLARAIRELALFRRLAARRYDLIVHLTDSWRGAWLARALGARWSVAPERRGGERFWRRSFSHLVPEPRGNRRHTVESHLDALRRIGVHAAEAERALVLEPGEPARAAVRALLAAQGVESRRFVHLHPASRWRFKCWTAEGWAEIIRRLQASGWGVVITSGPAPEEVAMSGAVQRLLAHPAIDLSGRLDLKELAALAAEARLFIGVDSAPMHVAAAMRTPAVALFGPSGETMWGPWGQPRQGQHRVVASDRHPCRPCGLDGCGGSKVSDCLVALEAERVWQAVSAALERSA